MISLECNVINSNQDSIDQLMNEIKDKKEIPSFSFISNYIKYENMFKELSEKDWSGYHNLGVEDIGPQGLNIRFNDIIIIIGGEHGGRKGGGEKRIIYIYKNKKEIYSLTEKRVFSHTKTENVNPYHFRHTGNISCNIDSGAASILWDEKFSQILNKVYEELDTESKKIGETEPMG